MKYYSSSNFQISRRTFIFSSLSILSSTSLYSAVDAKNVFTPESYGAHGNGTSSDGNAFYKMINAINKLPGSETVTIKCRGKYVITGGPRLSYPFKSPRNKEAGIIEGIPPLTRNNIFIDARGAEFIVPKSFHWQRTQRGGDKRDHFAVGWHFVGANCQMVGGKLLGNLDIRTVRRGPKPSNFGGQEFGLVMQGKNWKLTDVYAENWGTDCLNISTTGKAKKCTFKGGRRNCVSIVARGKQFLNNNIVLIDNCNINDGGNWPEHIRNNPGAGIDIEGIKNNLLQTVVIRNTRFNLNKMKDLQISRGAISCIIERCVFTNIIKLQPGQKGGHKFYNNEFKGDARIKTIYGMRKNLPIIFEGNHFQSKKFPPFRHRVIKNIRIDEQGQYVIFINNTALNWHGAFNSSQLFKKIGFFKNNITLKSRYNSLIGK